MHISKKGLGFIFRREALVLIPYRDGTMADPRDPTGPRIPRFSIGTGLLAEAGQETPQIEPIEGLVRARAVIEKLSRQVSWNLGIRNGSHMFMPADRLQWAVDSVTSLFFQGGSDGMKAVTAFVRQGDIDLASAEFLKWDIDSEGNHNAGLFRRRELERAIFDKGDYGELNPIKLYRMNPRQTKDPEAYNVPAYIFEGLPE